MSKLFYSVTTTNKGVQVCISEPDPQMVRFDNQMVPVEDVVSMLLCSGMSEQGVLDWLERRMEIGKFVRKEVIQ